jgi:hypothetical protein
MSRGLSVTFQFEALRSFQRCPYEHWYKNGDKKSKYALGFKNHDDRMKWYKKHWDMYSKCLTSKLKDWKNEKEYRIVYTDILNSFSNSGKKGYNFK